MPGRALVLASASPRRAELLRMLDLPFEVLPADVDETPLPDETPRQVALRLARAKALAIEPRHLPALVVAADTIVVIDGRILGKPVDDAETRRFLALLAGRTHEVITATATRACPEEWIEADAVTARVTFAPMSPGAIDWYAGTGEGRDKAGAYALQGKGALFVERVEGSYTNVIGLPLEWLRPRLARWGFLPETAA